MQGRPSQETQEMDGFGEKIHCKMLTNQFAGFTVFLRTANVTFWTDMWIHEQEMLLNALHFYHKIPPKPNWKLSKVKYLPNPLSATFRNATCVNSNQRHSLEKLSFSQQSCVPLLSEHFR